ncbi:MAG TPA: serpin family protein, partial [Paludibacteraceae bacterium]|nr:serpin family protein [Paludibacteraceae bacterium]HPH63981.1 serpin family protein [Paludibacteraceae bacterium]
LFAGLFEQDFESSFEHPTFVGDSLDLNEVNQWCSQKTNGKIDKILEEFSANVCLELLNAIYLKADWTNKFNKPIIMSDFQTNTNAKVSAEFMNDDRKIAYSENENLQYAELPLAKGDYVAFFVLPKEGKTISETAKYLSSNWNSVMNTNSTEVCITLPKFKVAYQLQKGDMSEVLHGIGINLAFTEDSGLEGCFSKSSISTKGGSPYVGNVVQKTTFELSESGIEATGATVIEVVTKNISDAIAMDLNRPFIYGIRDTKTGVILFNGCLNDPSAK